MAVHEARPIHHHHHHTNEHEHKFFPHRQAMSTASSSAGASASGNMNSSSSSTTRNGSQSAPLLPPLESASAWSAGRPQTYIGNSSGAGNTSSGSGSMGAPSYLQHSFAAPAPPLSSVNRRGSTDPLLHASLTANAAAHHHHSHHPHHQHQHLHHPYSHPHHPLGGSSSTSAAAGSQDSMSGLFGKRRASIPFNEQSASPNQSPRGVRGASSLLGGNAAKPSLASSGEFEKL
jgi:hypothetical protein